MVTKVDYFPIMKQYIGEKVRLVLNDKPKQYLTGILIDLDDDGGFGIKTSDGTKYGWPALYLEVDL